METKRAAEVALHQLPFAGVRPLSPAMHAADPGPQTLANWAGNYAYSTHRLNLPGSVSEVQDLVRQHRRLKVLGSRHCFNGIADSTEALVSLAQLNRVIALDPAAHRVTVEGGMTYGQLCPYLEAQGFALHNLASLPHISVVGACATATHGSGTKNGNLATAVAGFELVLADGSVRRFSRADGDERFAGMLVHLGALGVLTKITLEVQPTFQVRQNVYLDLPFGPVERNFEATMSAGYSVSLFTDWKQPRFTEVWVKRLAAGLNPAAIPTELWGAPAATTDVHPLAGLAAENCTPQCGIAGPWHERLPHFRMGFTPSSGQELQSEYFVPLDQAVAAIRALQPLGAQIRPHLLVSELRTVAADSQWLSMAYERASLGIHFTWKPDWESVRQVLPLIEAALAPFAPRPHWGKLFTMAPGAVRAQYRKLADFRRLAGAFDPHGKFRNAFLDSILA